MAKEDRIGAAWKPRSENENAPLAKGSIDFLGRKLDIVIWRNKWKKEGERTPDFYIELDKPREGQGEPRREVADARPAIETRSEPIARQPRTEVKPPSLDGFTDEIPF